MTKKHSLSDEEKNLFRDAMSDVKPLSPQNTINEASETPTKNNTENPISKSENTKSKKTITPKKILPGKTNTVTTDRKKFQLPAQPIVSGEDIISYTHTGLQKKRFAQLKQGKFKIEATLDLHEHTSDEALIAIDSFIERCQQRNMKTICIIHGKGNFSPEKTPVLKNLLNHYLREDSRVLAFHSATRTEGGTGAIYVLLKSPRQ